MNSAGTLCAPMHPIANITNGTCRTSVATRDGNFLVAYDDGFFSLPLAMS